MTLGTAMGMQRGTTLSAKLEQRSWKGTGTTKTIFVVIALGELQVRLTAEHSNAIRRW
jgi:hypothetical protein